MQLIIVMPVYNEAGCIAEVVADWSGMLAKNFSAEEAKILAVNDGSKDDTAVILDELAESNPFLIVQHQTNGGHGAAVLNGYNKAIAFGPSFIFQIDSDNQVFSADFDLLWRIREKSPMLLGWRKNRQDSTTRLLVTRVLRTSLFLLFGVKIKDSNNPFRLYKTSFLEAMLAQLPASIFAPNLFLSILAKRAGADLHEVPIKHADRTTGQVSIVNVGLLKVCVRSFRELIAFRKSLKKRAEALKKYV